MLSIDLFDSKYERGLHEGAVDDLEQHRIDILNDRMQELLARAKEASYKNDHAAQVGLKQQYDKIKAERDSYYKIREAQTGQDVVDRQAKMKALTPAQPGIKGAVKDVAQGLKNFLQGRPETGPTYESQKKKSEENPVKDVKLSRALQKARAKFPTANSNWEAYAKDTIETDSTQSTKIQSLSKELDRLKKDNESLTAMVQNLGQKIKSAPEPTAAATPVAKEPAKDKESVTSKEPIKIKTPAKSKDKETAKTQDKKPTPPATVGRPVTKPLKTIPASPALSAPKKTSALPAPDKYIEIEPNVFAPRQYAKVRNTIPKQSWNRDSKNITDVQFEHGGGIGPRQHWQDLMQEEEALIEGIRDTASATAVIACLLTGGSLTGCATAPQQTSSQQVLKTGQDVGRTVQTAKNITRSGVEAEVNQEIRNLANGLGLRPEELNNSNIIRIWRKIKGTPPVTPEPQAPEYGPGEPIKRTIREDNASEAAEQAILKRIMVAHTDLLKNYGPQKVMQAAEEVAYNVGDVAEIGSSDVSGWVNQVKQILGATA